MLPNNKMLRNIKDVSVCEGVDPKKLIKGVCQGKISVTCSKRGAKTVGFGEGLSPKFCVIVGTSSEKRNVQAVVAKAKLSVRYGASVIHDGSTGGDINKIRQRLVKEISVPLAFSHPVGAIAAAAHNGRDIKKIDTEELLDRVEYDIEMGAEILVLPIGITRAFMKKMLASDRTIRCTSKCGALITKWMMVHREENPYYSNLEKILKIAKKNNTILSFVGMGRSGCIADALDEIQLKELKIIQTVVKKALHYGVHVKAGSGGHIPINKIASFFSFQKKLFKVPIIAFGPQVTDASFGNDHISAAIGQSIALLSGADAFFIITPSEHIKMPTKKDIRSGCQVARMVVHSINIARGKDTGIDMKISRSRARNKCNICGEKFCAMEISSSLQN